MYGKYHDKKHTLTHTLNQTTSITVHQILENQQIECVELCTNWQIGYIDPAAQCLHTEFSKYRLVVGCYDACVWDASRFRLQRHTSARLWHWRYHMWVLLARYYATKMISVNTLLRIWSFLILLFMIAKDVRLSNAGDSANELPENGPQAKRKSSKRRTRLHPNIATSLNQLNGPLNLISLPDDLSTKLNFISSDTMASNRLFTTVLPTKQSSLRLNSNERFIDESNRSDAVEVWYSEGAVARKFCCIWNANCEFNQLNLWQSTILFLQYIFIGMHAIELSWIFFIFFVWLLKICNFSERNEL